MKNKILLLVVFSIVFLSNISVIKAESNVTKEEKKEVFVFRKEENDKTLIGPFYSYSYDEKDLFNFLIWW